MLLNISGGDDLALHEVNEAAEVVAQAVDPEANMIFGAIVDEKLTSTVKVTVVASGFREPRRDTRVSRRESEPAPEPEKRSERAREGVEIPSFLRNR